MSKASEADREKDPKLADEGWKRVQKKTFTGWCNYHLKKRECEVVDIEKDFGDGIKLCHLLEVISEQKIGLPHKAPKQRPQMLDNLSKSVKFINEFCKEIGVKLTYSAEQICDGGPMMLGLIWIFILRYSVGDISEEDKSAKEGLLLWVKKVLKPYDIKMDNFTRDWQDGRAFVGLIHRFHPDWIEDPMSLDKKENVANCNKAFQIAESKLAIPQLLDAQDLQEFPDEKSVITYVSFYWKAFAADSATLKAGTNLSKFFNRIKAQKAMQDDYEARANALNQWIEQKSTFFEAKDVGNSYEDALQKMKDFQEGYKVSEKPPKGGERVRLEVALANIHARIAKEGGPAYKVPEGLGTQDITLRWKRLLETEEEYERALREALIRKKKIQAFLGKFDQKCKLLNSWVSEKDSYLKDGVLGDSLYDTEGLIKKLDAFDEEFKAYASRYDAVKTLGDQIVAEDSTTNEYITSKLYGVNQNRDALTPLSEKKRADLNNRIAELRANEDRKVKFAKDTEVFHLWVEDITETLTDPIKCDHVDEVEKLIEQMPAITSEIEGKQASVDQITTDESSLIGTNPYTRYSAADVAKQYDGVKADLAARNNGLNEELTKQKAREDLRIAFGKHIDENAKFQAAIQAKLGALSGSLQEQKAACQALVEEKKGEASLLQASKESHEACLAADIHDNVHAKVSFAEISVSSLQLSDAIRDKLAEIERDIIKGDMPALSEEQLAEYREVFNHFDKDKSNSLELHEFKACLASVGQKFDDAQLAEEVAQMNLAVANKISFADFTSYMAKLNKEASSKDDIVASFKAFAPNGSITEEQLKNVLGEEELAIALASMPKNADGTYDYAGFCEQAFK